MADGRGTAGGRRTSTFLTMLVLSAISLCFALQQSLVVPALTTIQRDRHASATATTWLVTGFLLSSAVATPIVGRLGDMFGRARVLLLSLLTLAVGTVLAAIAPGIGLLIAARILQGMAGAIVPLSYGIARDVMPPRRVAGSIGVLSALLAVGAALGIIFSGPIVTELGVKWLFWLPMLALVPTIVAAWWFIPPSPVATREPIDVVGGLLLAAWLVCLLVAVSQATSWGWLGPKTLALYAAAVVFFVAWVWAELRCPVPLVDIHMLRRRTVASVNVVSFAAGFAMQSLFTFVTRFVQIPESTGFGLGVGASRAGLVVLPWSCGAFTTGMLSGRFAARYGSRNALVIGSAMSVVPCVLLAFLHDSVFSVCIAMGAAGIGFGFLTAAIPAIIVTSVPLEQTGVAAGMSQNVRTVGSAIGTQIFGAIVASRVLYDESAYVLGFLVVGGLCLLGVIASLVVPSDRPRRYSNTANGSRSASAASTRARNAAANTLRAGVALSGKVTI